MFYSSDLTVNMGCQCTQNHEMELANVGLVWGFPTNHVTDDLANEITPFGGSRLLPGYITWKKHDTNLKMVL